MFESGLGPEIKRVTVLYIDDERDDALLLSSAFLRVCTDVEVQWVDRAEKAIQYLEGKEEYADRSRFPLPGVVVLDLKLPGMSALEFLNWYAKSRFALIPVVACSGSADPRQHELARSHGARMMLLKPCGLDGLADLARQVRACC